MSTNNSKSDAINKLFPNGIELAKRRAHDRQEGTSPNANDGKEKRDLPKGKLSVDAVVINLYEKVEQTYSALASDATKEFDKYVNAADRKESSLKSLGDVIPVTNLMRSLVKYSLDMLSKLPNTTKNREMYLGTQIDEIDHLKNVLSKAKNSGSVGDLMQTILSLRLSLSRLMSTVNLLEADPGLLDTQEFIESHMWDGQVSDPYGSRDSLADNSLLPDMTFVKPIFLLFIDDKIKNELRTLKVSNKIINMLDNYTIPSYRWTGELGSVDSLDNPGESSPYSPVSFEWSKNGTIQKNTNTISAYQKNTTEFLNQIKAKYKLAQSKALMEYSMDIAVMEVLAAWLNGAFKALVESNMSIMPEVLKGVQFERDRMNGVDNASLALKYLMDSADQSGTSKAPFTALFESIDAATKANLGLNIYYNDYAYAFVKREFRTLTYSIDDTQNKYYIGSTLMGNHKIKINILPKLYLPVNLKDNIQLDFTLEDRTEVRAIDGFRFQLQLSNAFYVKDRDQQYNSTLVIYSIMHELIKMPANVYNTYLNSFLSSKGIVAYNGTMVPFSSIFESAFVERRELSGIPPHFFKEIILDKLPTIKGRVEIVGIEGDPAPEVKNKWFWPHMDMAFQKDIIVNDNGFWSPSLPYKLGDFIRSVYNFHADFSWVEMGAVFAQLMLKGEFNVYKPHKPALGDTGFNGYATITDLKNHTGDIRSSLIPHDSVYESSKLVFATGKSMATLMRAHNFTLKYTFKENAASLTWLDVFDRTDSSSLKPTLISKEDVSQSFRYMYHGNYLIDTYLYKKGALMYPIITSGPAGSTQLVKFGGVKRLIDEGKQMKISEEEVRNTILDVDYLNHSVLLFNERTENPCKGLTPVIIPGTDVVGYVIDSATKFDLNDINKFTYVKDNFQVYWKGYTISLPTNVNRNPHFVNNIHPARLTAYALIASGVIKANIQDALRILSTSFGVPVSNWDRVVFPSTFSIKYPLDAIDISKIVSNADIKDLTWNLGDAVDIAKAGFITSNRYGSYLIHSVTFDSNARYNTGYYALDMDAQQSVITSLLKSNKFHDMLGIPHFSRYQITDLQKTKRMGLINLTLAVNSNSNSWFLKVALKPQDIIRKLDLEDPTYAYERTII